MSDFPQCPVTRGTHGILWKGQPVMDAEFGEIRQYVDDCILKSSSDSSDLPTANFGLLLDLVESLEKSNQENIKEKSRQLPVVVPPLIPKPQLSHEAFLNPLAKLFEELDPIGGRAKYLLDYRRFEENRSEWESLQVLKRTSSKIPNRARFKSVVNPDDHPNSQKFQQLTADVKKSLSLYLFVRNEHASRLKRWRSEIKANCLRFQRDNLRSVLSPYFAKGKFINRLKRDIKTASGNVHSFERLHWQPLPAGGSLSRSIREHLAIIRHRYPSRQYDYDRLHRIFEMKPEKCFVGNNEFDGYVVFFFNACDVAVLECPWVGNALYLLDAEQWESLIKFSKAELLGQNERYARRIIHDRDGSYVDKLKHMISGR